MRKKIWLVCMVLVLVLGNMSLPVFAKVTPTLASMDEVYEEVYRKLEKGQREAVFYTDFPLDGFDYNRLCAIALERDPYAIYYLSGGWKYRYQMVGSRYECKVVMGDFFSGLMKNFRQRKVRARVREIADEVRGFSQYEQIKYVYDYLILNCEYELMYNGPYYALIEGKVCCNGYASAFYLIMDELGIPCKYTCGSDHAWNTVYLDGYWYNLDATWGDGGGNDINYDYFLKSNEDWKGRGPVIADALSSYPANNLVVRHDFPNWRLRDRIFEGIVIIAVVAGFILLLYFLNELYKRSPNSIHKRMERNKEFVRNMYQPPDE
ncbi:MAG: hypothetical protein HDT41_01095 [Lachnospiraceae bacterium]|nr:hypothetical protein [Lachnospiraceae bacterium]